MEGSLARITLSEVLEEETLAKIAKQEAIIAFQQISDKDLETLFGIGEKGGFDVTELNDLKNTTRDFNIVGFHEKKCGCTSVKRNPRCFPSRNRPN